jgi:hypothetical protein
MPARRKFATVVVLALIILFAPARGSTAHQVIGLTQGKFRVQRSGGGGAVQLSQTPPEHPPLEPPNHNHTEAAAPMVMPLAVLRDRVQLLLAKPAGGAR